MRILFSVLSQKRTPTDLFVAGFFEKEKLSEEIETLEPEFAAAAKAAIAKGRFEGKFAQGFSSYSLQYREGAEILLLGLGQKKKYKKICFKKAVGHMIQAAKARKVKHLRILIDSFTSPEVRQTDAAGLLAEVANLAAYQFDRYKSKKDDEPKKEGLEVIELVTLDAKSKSQNLKAVETHEALSEGIIFARNLINEPGNMMNPPALVKAAEELAAKKNLDCEILEQGELERLKMGGILSVNQGSCRPAALIVLEYGKRYKKNGTYCIVGKGVTFDTGGISIKPAKDMEKMKYDMSGAATVIATMGVLADLKLPVNVVALAPAVENMVAEDPQRPGDIIRMYNGKSVEVINTDAEGRLILGDALSYSEKYKPKAIIDLATLTGMCAYTFGDKAIAILGTDQRLIERVQKAGEDSGERCWQLPLWDDYADQIKGHHSDLLNVGGAYGGTITAAMFLKEFIPAKTPWVHLDIAGTAWSESGRYDCPKGATGVGVRLLTEFFSKTR